MTTMYHFKTPLSIHIAAGDIFLVSGWWREDGLVIGVYVDGSPDAEMTRTVWNHMLSDGWEIQAFTDHEFVVRTPHNEDTARKLVAYASELI